MELRRKSSIKKVSTRLSSSRLIEAVTDCIGLIILRRIFIRHFSTALTKRYLHTLSYYEDFFYRKFISFLSRKPWFSCMEPVWETYMRSPWTEDEYFGSIQRDSKLKYAIPKWTRTALVRLLIMKLIFLLIIGEKPEKTSSYMEVNRKWQKR